MSSTTTRVLLLRTGAAARWPVLRKYALQAPSPLAVVVARCIRERTAVCRAFGSSVPALAEGAGSDRNPIKQETTVEKVLPERETSPPDDSDATATVSEDGDNGDESASVAADDEGERRSLGTSTSSEESISTVSSDSPRNENVDPGTTLQAEASNQVAVAAPKQSPVPSFAFAFDIDGVLLHKSDPIPSAIKTLKFLQQHGIPFILLTNGGGKTEDERVAELNAKLDVSISTEQLVQSHTPFQVMVHPPPGWKKWLRLASGKSKSSHLAATAVPDISDTTILVLGSDASKARHIAQGYGFRSVVTPGDILKANPELYPFDPLSEFYDKQEILPLPKPIFDPRNANLKLEDCLKIDLILVFNDPRDWAVDIQLIMDLLTSHRGYLGTYSSKNGGPPSSTSLPGPRDTGWQNDGQPFLVYSNSDLLWSTGYHLPRFGQGAFQAAVEGAFSAVTSSARIGMATKPVLLQSFKYGKPSWVTYRYATEAIWRQFGTTQWGEFKRSSIADSEHSKGLDIGPRNIYMVGDNPASDIQGAVSYRASASRPHKQKDGMLYPVWHACLVKTGVWNEDRISVESLGAKPDTVQDNVLAAVKWALEKEGWPDKLE